MTRADKAGALIGWTSETVVCRWMFISAVWAHGARICHPLALGAPGGLCLAPGEVGAAVALGVAEAKTGAGRSRLRLALGQLLSTRRAIATCKLLMIPP